MSDFLSSSNQGWRRWQPRQLDAYQDLEPAEGKPAAEPAAAGDTGTESMAAEERERIYQEAFAAGEQHGYTNGYADGQAKGIEEAQQAADKALEDQREELTGPLRALTQQLPAAWQQLGDELLQELSQLAIQVGEQLAVDHLTQRPEQITGLVSQLLQEEPMVNEQPRLWLHPADLALVRESLGETLQGYGWQLLADPALSRGGCLIRSQHRELDARWETRVQRIEALLTKAPDRNQETER